MEILLIIASLIIQAMQIFIQTIFYLLIEIMAWIIVIHFRDKIIEFKFLFFFKIIILAIKTTKIINLNLVKVFNLIL